MREVELNGFLARERNLVALIDDDDFDLVAGYRWYPQVRKGGSISAMRHILLPEKHSTQFMHGLIMSALWVDHADGDPLNNQRANLRVATPGQNACNASKRRDARTSRFKGVHWRARSERWVAQIQAGRKKRHLGYYETEKAAALAYDTAATELFGEFARLNLPEIS